MNVNSTPDYIRIHRSWRSLWQSWILAIILGIITIFLTGNIEGLTLPISLSDSVIELPILGLIWLFVIARPLILMRDSEYVISPHHIRAIHGKASITLDSREYAYEDLVGVRIYTSVMGRAFNFGDLIIGSKDSNAESVELVGIHNPHMYLKIISSRIDSARIEERKVKSS
jgi:hypothetical protein